MTGNTGKIHITRGTTFALWRIAAPKFDEPIEKAITNGTNNTATKYLFSALISRQPAKI